MEKNYSIPEVARILNVHRNTVLNWVRLGYVQATIKNAITSRPHYLISAREVDRIKRSQNVAA